MTRIPTHSTRTRRALAIAAATGAGLVPIVAAVASAADPAPASAPSTTSTGTETTVPEVPAGVPITIGQSTFTFADGPYYWASTHGSVLDSDGEVTLEEGAVTFLAATSGMLLVPQDAPEPYELIAGTAIPRDESLATTLSVPEGAPAGYVAIDIQPGALVTDPPEAPETTTTDTTVETSADTIADTTIAADSAASSASAFTPGPGVRTVTLHRVVMEPGASFDAASIAHEFGYVVVIKGVLDTAGAETLYTFGTLQLPGAAELTNASGTATAEILVATVAPTEPSTAGASPTTDAANPATSAPTAEPSVPPTPTTPETSGPDTTGPTTTDVPPASMPSPQPTPPSGPPTTAGDS
jgi:hypothetical protein